MTWSKGSKDTVRATVLASAKRDLGRRERVWLVFDRPSELTAIVVQSPHDVGVSLPNTPPFRNSGIICLPATSTLHPKVCDSPRHCEIGGKFGIELIQFRLQKTQIRKLLFKSRKSLFERRPATAFGGKLNVHLNQRWIYDVGDDSALLRPLQGLAANRRQSEDYEQKPHHLTPDTTVTEDRNWSATLLYLQLFRHFRSALHLTVIGLWLATACPVACEPSPALPKRSNRNHLPSPAASGVDTLAPLENAPKVQLSPEVQGDITKLRNETLRYAPMEDPIRRLEFFGTHLARLTRDALYLGNLVDRTEGEVWIPKRTLLHSGRELVRLADDSLLVVTATSTWLFDADGKPQSPLGKVAYFPGMRLWPELRWPRAFATLESSSGNLALYRWDEPASSDAASSSATSVGTFFLPKNEITLEGLSSSACNLLLDGSYACIKGMTLYTGWPGYPPKRLGTIEPGATVVRVLPGDRVDHLRVLRSDARLEEYWAVSPPKYLSTLSLPWMPFDVARLKGALAVLRLEQGGSPALRFSLSVIEASGHPRWTKPLDGVRSPCATEDFDREILACRSLAVHPKKPWIGVSDCRNAYVFDSQTGTELAKLENVRY